MYCEKCGKALPEDVTICPQCGYDCQPEPVIMNSGMDSHTTTNGMAVGSLITGLLGMSFIAIILGIIANNQIKASKSTQQGSGLAIAGIILGCLWFVVGILYSLFISFSVFSTHSGGNAFSLARSSAKKAACLSNLKQLGLGLNMYIQDYDEKLPPVNQWSDAVYPYVKNKRIYICPSDTNPQCSYSFYDRVVGVKLKQILKPAETPAIFDGPGGWNASSSINSAVSRHENGFNVTFIDGHAKWQALAGGKTP